MAQQPSNEGRRARTIPNGPSSSRPAQNQQQAQPNTNIVNQAMQQFQQLPPDQQQQVLQFAMQNFPRTAQNASRALQMLNNNPEYADRAINESRNGSFSPHAFRGQPDPHEPVPIFDLIGRSLNPPQAAPQAAQANVPTPPTRPAASRSNAASRTSPQAARTNTSETNRATGNDAQSRGGNMPAERGAEIVRDAAREQAVAVNNAAAPAARQPAERSSGVVNGANAAPVATTPDTPPDPMLAMFGSHDAEIPKPTNAPTQGQHPIDAMAAMYRRNTTTNAQTQQPNNVPPEEVARIDNENRAAQAATQAATANASQGEASWLRRIFQGVDDNLPSRETAANVRATIADHMPAMPNIQELGAALNLGAQPIVNAAQNAGVVRSAQGGPTPEQSQRIDPALLRKPVNATRDSSDVGDGIERYADELLAQ